MFKKLIAISIATASIYPTFSHADGIDRSMFSVKGFGTVGFVHSSEDQADFVGTTTQPNGAGYTHTWEGGVDSKLGVQLNANFTDKFSAVVQAVSQHQYDDTWRPMIEWANIKYQITPDLSVRAGRIVLPAFLISDSRLVGYSTPWVRPPEEVYFNSLATNSDGGDITYHMHFGDVTNTVQAFYGTATAKLSTSRLEAKPDWGVNDTVEINALTLRAGYVSYKVDFKSDGFDAFRAGIGQFAAGAGAAGFATEAAQANALLRKYDSDNMNLEVYTLGANYDPGEWFLMGEYAHFKGDSILVDADSFYVTAGYRIEQFTPYVTFAQVKSDKETEAGISTSNPALASTAAALNGGINASLAAGKSCQRTAAIGVRWDFMPSADLKLQYERKSTFDDSNGRLFNATANFEPNGDFNVISAAVDFVF